MLNSSPPPKAEAEMCTKELGSKFMDHTVYYKQTPVLIFCYLIGGFLVVCAEPVFPG